MRALTVVVTLTCGAAAQAANGHLELAVGEEQVIEVPGVQRVAKDPEPKSRVEVLLKKK